MAESGSKDYKEQPSARLAGSYCYSQVYAILKEPANNFADAKTVDESMHETFFRCGNWCYQGIIQFNDMSLTLSELPRVIPVLQRQQGNLRYYCNSNSIPKDSVFHSPIGFMTDAVEFIAGEVSSDHVDKELRRWSSMFSWIDDDNSNTYFELAVDPPDYMNKIGLLACKTYTRGLVIISVYFEGNIYFLLQQGEGDQQLLDVRFPDVSKHGQGLQLCCYTGMGEKLTSTSLKTGGAGENDTSCKRISGSGDDEDGPSSNGVSAGADSKGNGRATPASGSGSGSNRHYRKLTLWHIMDDKQSNSNTTSTTSTAVSATATVSKVVPKLKTLNVSSSDYIQTYCIMKSLTEATGSIHTGANMLSMHHDVLFRFGNWCYTGRVQLIPSLSLSDVPFVIPALRMQQSRLEFSCEAGKIPANSPYAPTLQFMNHIETKIEEVIVQSEDVLNGLIDRLTRMGLGESVKKWLEGDPENSFFEFKMNKDPAVERILEPMELVCSKCYHASGIITMTILFEYSVYVCVLDGSNENPLLDSRFPDVSGKGRGYQIQSYDEGIPGWSQLRKVSVWQTVSSLEQEFRERAGKLVAQAKEQLLGENEDVETGSNESTGEVTVATTIAPSTAESKAAVSAPAERSTKAASPTSAASPAPLTTPMKAEEKSSGAGSGSADKTADGPAATTTSPSTLGSLSRPSVSAQLSAQSSVAFRPHHLPKMALNDGLSKRMDEIRKQLGGGDETEQAAPWDSFGRPLTLGAGSLAKK